jgi:hypothetical protein
MASTTAAYPNSGALSRRKECSAISAATLHVPRIPIGEVVDLLAFVAILVALFMVRA